MAETRRLVSSFAVLPGSHLLKTDRFVRWQDADVDWMRPDECWLLVFVSHRWETLWHPDPDGRQHQALVSLVLEVCDLADAVIARDAGERIRLASALDRHGTVQAAVLLSRLALPERVGDWRAEGRSAREILPAHIGIWYDYACLPQLPRSVADEAMFREALIGLPELFRSDAVSLVAVREAGDDYTRRAWCLAEALLTAHARERQGLALRADLMGRSLEFLTADADRDYDLSGRFEAALAGWRDPTVDPEGAGPCLLLVAALAGNSPSDWFSSEDGIPPVSLGETVIQAGVWAGLILGELARSTGRAIDLTVVLRDLARRAGVQCAVENDLVYVTLLMLEGIAAADTAVRAFFGQCLRRHLSDRPLVVRPSIGPGREFSYEDLRYEFQDEL